MYYFRNFTLLQCFDDLDFKKYGLLNVYENDLDAVKSRFFMFRIENQVVSIMMYTMVI